MEPSMHVVNIYVVDVKIKELHAEVSEAEVRQAAREAETEAAQLLETLVRLVSPDTQLYL